MDSLAVVTRFLCGKKKTSTFHMFLLRTAVIILFLEYFVLRVQKYYVPYGVYTDSILRTP